MSFKGKSIIITGAGRGFGRMAAERFAGEGARLTLQDISTGDLEETAETIRKAGGEVVALAGDVSEETHHLALTELAKNTFGEINIAINNAGIGGLIAPITDIKVEDFDRIMAVNARGVFLGMKHQLPAMIKAGSGAILNVASAAGILGAGHLGAYAASKHAVVGLTRAAADEYARMNIRINAICSSFASTAMFNEMADYIGQQKSMTREQAEKHISARIPMRRVAQPEEVVQAMLWIVSPENSFMTGQAVSIDGGLSAV